MIEEKQILIIINDEINKQFIKHLFSKKYINLKNIFSKIFLNIFALHHFYNYQAKSKKYFKI